MTDPWAEFEDVSAPQTGGRQGIVLTDPAQQATEMRARESDARAAEKAEQERIRFEREQRAAGITGGVDTTEAEKTAAFLATRVAGGLQMLSQFQDTGPELDASIAGVFGENARTALNSPDRQRIEAAQRDVLDAALTLGTGAAYTVEQLDGYRQSYFPSYFDAPETIADKRQRLKVLLEAARVKAGAAAPQIDRALQAAGMVDEGEPEAGPIPRAKGARGDTGIGATGVQDAGTGGLVPIPEVFGIGDRVAGMIQQGAGIDQVKAFLDQAYQPIGVSASGEQLALLRNVIQRHRADPRVPVKSLASGWDMFHYRPAPEGESTIVGQVADSVPGAMAIGAADIASAGFLDEIVDATGGTGAAVDFSRQERPYSFTAGQLAGGLMLPSGVSGAGRAAGTAVLRGGGDMAAARLAAGQATTRRIAGEGAAYGAAYGAGSAEGGIDDRLAGAATGGAVGGVGGLALGKAGQTIAGRAGRAGPAAGGLEYLEAAQRSGIDPIAADVGGAATKRIYSGTIQTPYGVNRLTAASEKVVEQAQARRDELASRIGTPAKSGEALGYTLKAGAERALAGAKSRAQTTYQAAAREAGDARLQTRAAFQVLSDNIDDLTQTGIGDAGLSILKRLQTRMVEGPMTVQTARNIRTALRDDFATQNLRGSDIERRAGQVLDALTDDIDTGLRAQGKDAAADLFRKADAEYRAYVELADEVVIPLIGKDGGKSGEDVAKALMRDLQGNNARAVKFMRALPAEEQSTARASIIAGLGRARKGGQNAEGDAFSLSTFLTNWDEIGETAKVAYFGDLRPALNDLAKVAEGSREAMRFANSSNTGGANAVNFTNGGLTGALIALVAGNVPIAVGLASPAASQAVSARVLTSPTFIRWLAAAPKKPNAAAKRAHIARLSGIAKANPAIAESLTGFQRTLLSALEQSPGRAAAQEENDSGREPPAQQENAAPSNKPPHSGNLP